jgi:hypothetical protein
MARISDRDRTVFEEAYKTVLDNFTEGELAQIGRLAGELRNVIEGAKKRLAPGSGGTSVDRWEDPIRSITFEDE